MRKVSQGQDLDLRRGSGSEEDRRTQQRQRGLEASADITPWITRRLEVVRTVSQGDSQHIAATQVIETTRAGLEPRRERSGR